ncbi:hypothetical protein [Streptomyces sp. NPDC005573]|uniref:hypothetical protein n=1 Tax=Streptomyces sp. NPDC005573 TaxID=3156890 RepID=UPI0033B5DBC8
MSLVPVQPPPSGQPGGAWGEPVPPSRPEPPWRTRGLLLAVLAWLVATVTVAVVVLTAAGQPGSSHSRAPEGSGTSADGSPRPSASLPAEEPGRLTPPTGGEPSADPPSAVPSEGRAPVSPLPDDML